LLFLTAVFVFGNPLLVVGLVCSLVCSLVFTLVFLFLAFCQPSEVRRFLEDYLLGPETDGVFAPREAEDGDSVGDARDGPGADDFRPDFVVGERTEQFAEARQALVEKRLYRFDGHVVGGDAGAAGRNDTVGVLAAHEAVDGALDTVVIVTDEFSNRHFVAGLGDDFDDRFAGRILVDIATR
jgi:hypothetical protein